MTISSVPPLDSKERQWHGTAATVRTRTALLQLKQIVNGIREEMRYYLANGNGTPRSFWRWPNERTTQEMQIYERTRRELENETSPETWESKNEALRRIGLRTIAKPKKRE